MHPPEFDLALVEMYFGPEPLGLGDGPVLMGLPGALAAPVEECLVVADHVLVEDGDVAPGCLEIQVSEQGGSDVDRQPVVD